MPLIGEDGQSYDSQFHFNKQKQDEYIVNRTINIESGGRPGQRTGSNVGLGQWGPSERRQYNITNPDDYGQNYNAILKERQEAGRIMGRNITGAEGYIIHQQGKGGGPAILNAPRDQPMMDVLQKYYPNEGTRAKAITQNIKGFSPDVTAGQWTDFWTNKFNTGKAERPPDSPWGHYPGFKNAFIDRDHHVPLLAGALMDNDGKVYGTAIDSRIPHVINMHDDQGNQADIDSAMFVHLHEMEEVKNMEGKNGTLSKGSSKQAYTSSHNQVATPREQAAVEKWSSEHGLEPSSTWANYQKFWQNSLPIVDKNEPTKVHPHLYLHPYDGHKYQAQMEKLSGRTIVEHPKALAGGKEYLPRKPADKPPKLKEHRELVASEDDIEKKRQKEMDDLSKGLRKDKDPFGGLLDLIEEEEAKTKA